jgi:putative RNA ligase
VLARPFEKFFDLAQIEVPQDSHFTVTEKVDGSLGILYPTANGWRITTRGDPNGWQSTAATELWNERYRDFVPPDGVTMLFEIVLPENRIVVDYGDRRELVALTAIDMATGRDTEVPEAFPGPRVAILDNLTGLDVLVAEAEKTGNQEGFVLYWPQEGLRAKVKLSEYRRLHQMIFGTSTKAIWELLAAGQDPLAAVADGPADLRDWVERARYELVAVQAGIMADAATVVSSLPPATLADRRAAAEVIKASRYPSVAFALLDRRPGRPELAAWKLAKPQQAEVFRSDTESL